MEAIQIMPTKAGQICKILQLMPSENPDTVYIISEDPNPFDTDDMIYVTDLKDLQRNINAPQFTPKFSVSKNNLHVLAENIEEYISSWNFWAVFNVFNFIF